MVKLKRKINESSTPVNNANTDYVIKLLKTLFAEEILAWYQYYIVSKFMIGHERPSISKQFEEIAKDELDDHADKILKRISELGGNISNIDDIVELKNVANCAYIVPSQPYSTIQLLEDNIKSEACAIKHYIDLINFTKDDDYTTYCMAMDILADEEEHLRDLQDFYADITGAEYDLSSDDDAKPYDSYVDQDGHKWTQTPEMGKFYVLTSN